MVDSSDRLAGRRCRADDFIPACTVVVCTRNRPGPLAKCLDALRRLTYPHFEILVVDNAPTTERAMEIAARFGVRYIIEPVPGLSRARNRGVRSCDTNIVAFIDDDAVPEPNWLTNLVSEFKDPAVMAVAGRILPLRVQTTAERESALVDGFGDQRRVVDRDTPLWFELANFGGLGDGGNMAFRRRAFEMWPGFDERLGRGAVLREAEEHHAFFSLLDRGYSVVYTPYAIVRHPYPRTVQDLRRRYLRLNTASTAYLTLLFFEEPRYRRRIARYVAEALSGKSRPWRQQPNAAHPGIRAFSTVLARLRGPLLYLQATIEKQFFQRSAAPIYHERAENPHRGIDHSCPLAQPLAVAVPPAGE